MTFASCSVLNTNHYDATAVGVATGISSTNVADLEVGERSSYRYTTTAEDRKAGVDNCKRAAVWNFLKNNGNADVIVSPEFHYDTNYNYVEVTGRPAKYKNFRGAN